MDRRTNARQAWYLAAYEEAGVGYEFLDRYVGAVRAVTAADLQRVAQRYLAVIRTIVVQPTPPCGGARRLCGPASSPSRPAAAGEGCSRQPRRPQPGRVPRTAP